MHGPSSAEPRVEREASSIQRLVGVIQRLSSARDVGQVRDIVRRAARELTGADGATLVLRDGDQCYYVDEDAIAPLWKGKRFPMSACISGWSMLHRESVVIPDIYADARIPADAYRPTFVKSLAMVPAGDPSIAAIGNYWATPHRATDAEVELLRALADSASIAIHNVLLQDDLRAERDRAEAASRLKDEFLMTISHELRTPLVPMLGWSSLIAAGDLDGDELRDAAREIHEAATDQSRLIEGVLDVSRIVSGGFTLELRACDLRAIALEATRSLAPAADAKGLRVELALGERECPLLADASRLRQVVWNLLSNAVKFTPAGGSIRVALARAAGEVRLSVADTGQGIAHEFLAHVFDRFRQADGGTTRRVGGLGLGLAIARHLVELHGGSVIAESAGLGLGARFTVALPLRVDAPLPVRSGAPRGDDDAAAVLRRSWSRPPDPQDA